MKAPALVALTLLALSAAAPVAAQSFGYPDQARSYSSYGRYGHDFNGQADRPGDYRCDAYWDRGRDDCGAAWRDQRPYGRQYDTGRDARSHGSGRHTSYGYGQGGYGAYGQNRWSGQGDRYAYQPYSQGTQYYGAYGRPDQVYPGGGYGQVGGYRDTGRSGYCASRYRSYDPNSGYYRAYSGRLVFCG